MNDPSTRPQTEKVRVPYTGIFVIRGNAADHENAVRGCKWSNNTRNNTISEQRKYENNPNEQTWLVWLLWKWKATKTDHPWPLVWKSGPGICILIWQIRGIPNEQIPIWCPTAKIIQTSKPQTGIHDDGSFGSRTRGDTGTYWGHKSNVLKHP